MHSHSGQRVRLRVQGPHPSTPHPFALERRRPELCPGGSSPSQPYPSAPYSASYIGVIMQIEAPPSASAPSLIGGLALACMAAAVLSGTILGAWEVVHPFFGHSRYNVVASPPQLWTYAAVQALKPFGFVAGLFGFFLVATRRGVLLKAIMSLAALGGIFYAIVWIRIAVTVRDDAIYILKRPIGSDVHSNGGAMFLWLAPIALGIAAFFARRVSRWQSIWPIIVGFAGSRIFGLFPPGVALMIEACIWTAFGFMVYLSRRGAKHLIGTQYG